MEKCHSYFLSGCCLLPPRWLAKSKIITHHTHSACSRQNAHRKAFFCEEGLEKCGLPPTGVRLVCRRFFLSLKHFHGIFTLGLISKTAKGKIKAYFIIHDFFASVLTSILSTQFCWCIFSLPAWKNPPILTIFKHFVWKLEKSLWKTVGGVKSLCDPRLQVRVSCLHHFMNRFSGVIQALAW